ncbi:MAG: hypothetical protein ACRC41_16015 [Sarcina sp.]
MSGAVARRPEGCTKLHIWEQELTVAGELNYLEAIRLWGLEEITSTSNYTEGSAYSDNTQDTYVKKTASVDLTILVRELATKTEALIMGKDFIKGKKVSRSTDRARKFAVAYEQTNSDGSSTFKLYYNCTLAKDEAKNTTIKDGIEYDVITITGKALPCPELGGALDLEFESDADGVTAQDITNFFKTVTMPPEAETPAKESLKIKK